jgi:hypothetical protein
MTSFINSAIFLMTLLGLVLVTGTLSIGNFVSGQLTLDLKTPGGNEAFGGDNKGSVLLVPKEHSVSIVANMDTSP